MILLTVYTKARLFFPRKKFLCLEVLKAKRAALFRIMLLVTRVMNLKSATKAMIHSQWMSLTQF